MAVIRVNKNKNFTTMSNYHFKDKKMSLKAKGLLSLMLSLPDDWNYSIQGLTSICKECDKSIRHTLEELKELNYLKVTQERTEKGQFTYIYDIFEMPHCPDTQKRHAVKRHTVKVGLLNTNNKNTKNKEKVNKKKSYTNYEQREYTKEDLNKLMIIREIE